MTLLMLKGHDQRTVGANIRTLMHEERNGIPRFFPKQAVAIAMKEARKTGEPTSAGEEVLVPRVRSDGKRLQADLALSRGLALNARRGKMQEAQKCARELAELRGHPRSWPTLLEAAGGKVSRHPGRAIVRHDDAGDAPNALASFYDAHPKAVHAAVLTGTLIGGLRLNAQYPEGVSLDVGPISLNAKPSTWGALGLGVTALLARHFEWERTMRTAATGTVGFGLATAISRQADKAASTDPGL
jgi:hypothetical protein